MFSYLYYNSYVGAEVGVTVGSVLSSAVQLSRREQLELWGLLANLLAGMSPLQLIPYTPTELAHPHWVAPCIAYVSRACCAILNDRWH